MPLNLTPIKAHLLSMLRRDYVPYYYAENRHEIALMKVTNAVELLRWLINFEQEQVQRISAKVATLDVRQSLLDQYANNNEFKLAVRLDELIAYSHTLISAVAEDMFEELSVNVDPIYQKIRYIYDNLIIFPRDLSENHKHMYTVIKNFLLLHLLKNNEQSPLCREFIEQLYDAISNFRASDLPEDPISLVFRFTQKSQILSISRNENEQTGSTYFIHPRNVVVLPPGADGPFFDPNENGMTKLLNKEEILLSRAATPHEKAQLALYLNRYITIVEELEKRGITPPTLKQFLFLQYPETPVEPYRAANFLTILFSVDVDKKNELQGVGEDSRAEHRMKRESDYIKEVGDVGLLNQLGMGLIVIEPDFNSNGNLRPSYLPASTHFPHEFTHCIANLNGVSAKTYADNDEVPLLDAYYRRFEEYSFSHKPSGEEFRTTIGAAVSEKTMAQSMGFNETRVIYSATTIHLANLHTDHKQIEQLTRARNPELEQLLTNKPLNTLQQIPTALKARQTV